MTRASRQRTRHWVQTTRPCRIFRPPLACSLGSAWSVWRAVSSSWSHPSLPLHQGLFVNPRPPSHRDGVCRSEITQGLKSSPGGQNLSRQSQSALAVGAPLWALPMSVRVDDDTTPHPIPSDRDNNSRVISASMPSPFTSNIMFLTTNHVSRAAVRPSRPLPNPMLP
jgi:hypothetical protein